MSTTEASSDSDEANLRVLFASFFDIDDEFVAIQIRSHSRRSEESNLRSSSVCAPSSAREIR